MNMNQITNMVIRRLIRLVMNKGISAGTNALQKRYDKSGTEKSSYNMDTKGTRQTMKVLRRFSRF